MGKSLIGQIGIVAVLTILSKAGAFAKDVLLSYIFGAGASTDAYFIANAIPGLVFAGFFSTIGLVFLPIYTRTLNKPEKDSQNTINNAIVIYISIAMTLSVFTIVFAEWLVKLSAPGASNEVLKTAATLTRILAIGFVFSGWVGIHNAIQQSHKSFILPITVPVVNNLAVIIGLIVSMYFGGIILVAIFAILGWALQAPIHGFLARGYYKLKPNTPISSKLAKQLLILSIPVFFSVFLDQFNIIIDLVLSSGFGGGAISHLSFAARLSLFLSGLFSLLVSYFIFPHLSDSLASGDITATNRTLGFGLGVVILLTTPLSIMSILLDREIISIIFQRGAFTETDVAATAEILKFYAAGILFIAIREVFNRLFYSDQRTTAPLVFAAISAAINIASSLYLMETMGVAGIAAGTSIGAAAYVVMQTGYILRWDKRLLAGKIMFVIATATISGIAMIYVASWLKDSFDHLSAVPLLILIIGVSGVTYAAIALPAGYFIYKDSFAKNSANT